LTLRLRGIANVVAVTLLAAMSPAYAMKPEAADEAAIRGIIQQVYSGYSRRKSESPETVTEGYQPPYSASLDALIQKWMPVGSGEDVTQMNSYDWYCQCQDYDPKHSTVATQQYEAMSKSKIEAKVEFAPMGGKGKPLTFVFIRENGQWVMDDLRFADGNTLRNGLHEDIAGAALTNAI